MLLSEQERRAAQPRVEDNCAGISVGRRENKEHESTCRKGGSATGKGEARQGPMLVALQFVFLAIEVVGARPLRSGAIVFERVALLLLFATEGRHFWNSASPKCSIV